VKHGVPLAEGSSAAVLAAEPDRSAIQDQRAERERLGQGPVDAVLVKLLPPALELPGQLGVGLEIVRRVVQAVHHGQQGFPRNRGGRLRTCGALDFLDLGRVVLEGHVRLEFPHLVVDLP